MVEGHGKHEVCAGLEETVGAGEVSDFTLAGAEQWAHGAADGVGAAALVDAETQVDRVPLQTLLAPARTRARARTHTHTRLTFFQDYMGQPVPER